MNKVKFSIPADEPLTLDKFKKRLKDEMRKVTEALERERKEEVKTQKEKVKKFIRYLENNQIRVSEKNLNCLGNRDRTISQDIYKGLVEAFGEDIVQKAMIEELGKEESSIRLSNKSRLDQCGYEITIKL